MPNRCRTPVLFCLIILVGILTGCIVQKSSFSPPTSKNGATVTPIPSDIPAHTAIYPTETPAQITGIPIPTLTQHLAQRTFTKNPTPPMIETPIIIYSLGDMQLRLKDGMEMVYVPDGEFNMGSTHKAALYALELCKESVSQNSLHSSICSLDSFSNEKPAHPVRLQSYWIDKKEVTNQQYAICVNDGACTLPEKLGSFTRDQYYDYPAFANYPVVYVRWDQASTYCRWAGGRLPTEAEWEYAARGPGSLIYPWGDTFEPDRLNYCDSSCPAGLTDPSNDDQSPDTAPVGSYPEGASWVNALDMAGNVREWVADWYGLYSSDRRENPQGPPHGNGHIPRGGSWLDTPDDVRSANRGENSPDYSRHKVGFRCVVDLEDVHSH